MAIVVFVSRVAPGEGHSVALVPEVDGFVDKFCRCRNGYPSVPWGAECEPYQGLDDPGEALFGKVKWIAQPIFASAMKFFRSNSSIGATPPSYMGWQIRFFRLVSTIVTVTV
jgi:hypothetical protein